MKMLNFESSVPFQSLQYDQMVMTAKDAYQRALDQFTLMQSLLRKQRDGLSPDEISDEDHAMMSLTVKFNLKTTYLNQYNVYCQLFSAENTPVSFLVHLGEYLGYCGAQPRSESEKYAALCYYLRLFHERLGGLLFDHYLDGSNDPRH